MAQDVEVLGFVPHAVVEQDFGLTPLGGGGAFYVCICRREGSEYSWEEGGLWEKALYSQYLLFLPLGEVYISTLHWYLTDHVTFLGQ